MPEGQRTGLGDLNERSRQILRHVVDAYVETGEPIGSRTISRRLGMSLSPATIRNVMSDLEEAGLLYAPHTSAGRLPTESGLRIFVNGLLEVGDLTKEERANIEGQCAAAGRSVRCRRDSQPGRRSMRRAGGLDESCANMSRYFRSITGQL